ASYLFGRAAAPLHTFAIKAGTRRGRGERDGHMTDDRRNEIPLVPPAELRDAAPLSPQPPALPEANRRRLEALLRELLRDDAVRKLLCNAEKLAAQPRDGI